MNPSLKPLLKVQDMANVLNVTNSRAAEMIRIKLFPDKGVVRLGRQIRVDPDVLAEFVATGGKPLEGGWKREANPLAKEVLCD
jgi:hypothetical protein